MHLDAFRVSRNNYRELTESRFTLAISTSEHARGNHLTLSQEHPKRTG